MMLAGAPGMPRLTEIMGEVAIEQGRVQEEGQEPQRLAARDDDGVARGVTTVPTADTIDDDDNELEDESPAEDSTSPHLQERSDLATFGHHIENPRRRQTVGAARTSPALPLHVRNIRKPKLSDDPLGQNDPPSPVRLASPYQSSPSISTSSKHQYHSSVASGTDILLQKYDLQSQSHLLRSQYCRSEVRRAS